MRPIAGAAGAGATRRQGRWAEALAWARERGPVAPRTTSDYLREFEHVTLARALLARYAAERRRALARRGRPRLLERLLGAAEAGGRTGSVIEILVLRALADQARGDLAGRARGTASAR